MGFCACWWCSKAKGGILANNSFSCKKHTNLYKYWSKRRRCFLRYLKYSCQVCCIVFSATARKCKRIGVFEMMGPTLEGIRRMVPMPKEWWHIEKAVEKMVFGSSTSYCFTIAAVPGTGACLDSRSRRNGGLCACMGLLICNLNTQSLFSRSPKQYCYKKLTAHILYDTA